jgi:uncharacterized protein (DUF1501 family)
MNTKRSWAAWPGCNADLPEPSRRQFLGWSALGLAGLALGPTTVLRDSSAAGPVRRLVIINLFGGNDGLNTVVPHGLAAYFRARPNLALPAEELLPVDALYGLHPALVNTAALMRAGHAAVVHQVGYPEPNFSHFESMSIWSRGIRQFRSTPDKRGWIGRLCDLYFPRPADVVGLGVGYIEDLVASTARPLSLETIDAFDLIRPPHLGAENDARAAAVTDLLATRQGEPGYGGALAGAAQRAYELVEVVRAGVARYQSRVAYPDTTLGQLLRDAARLIAADLGTRIVYTGFGGFDTHAAQAGLHPRLLAELDGALGAFVADLRGLGEWDRTLLVVISEFGRTNFENGSQGTDHGSGNVLFVLGTRLRGTQFGPPLTEASLAQERIQGAYEVDFRSVYKEILSTFLNVDPAPVFPEPEERPVRLGLL